MHLKNVVHGVRYPQEYLRLDIAKVVFCGIPKAQADSLMTI